MRLFVSLIMTLGIAQPVFAGNSFTYQANGVQLTIGKQGLSSAIQEYSNMQPMRCYLMTTELLWKDGVRPFSSAANSAVMWCRLNKDIQFPD